MSSIEVRSRGAIVVIVHPAGSRDVMLWRSFREEREARVFAARHAKPDRWVELALPSGSCSQL